MSYRLFEAFAHNADKGSRSTALHSLNWVILLIAGTFASTGWWAPEWLRICFMIVLCLLVATFIGSFFYLLFTDRDALRSEKYSLSKMAMEKGLIGDNLLGLREPDGVSIKELPQLVEAERKGDE